MSDRTPRREERAAQASSPKAFPRILNGRRRGLFARLLANGVLQALAALALPFAILQSPLLPVWQAVLMLSSLAGVLIVLRIVELVDAEKLGLDYVAQVRLSLFDGLTGNAVDTPHGIAMSRLMNDLSALKNWIGLGIARSVVAGFAFIGCAAAAATLSLHHAIIILAPALLLLCVVVFLVAPFSRRVTAVRRARGKLAGLLGDALLSLNMLHTYGQVARSRRRIKNASRALNASQARRMRLAATLRALPEAMLPFAVVAAIALQMPLRTDSIGLLLLVGLSIGPVRQALRTLEYRAAFLVARDRLAKGLGVKAEVPQGQEEKATPRLPGLKIHSGPIDAAWGRIAGSGTPVTAAAPVLRRSLRRNIDITNRFRGDDEGLMEIADFCGLLGLSFAPDGLDTRLSPNSPDLTEPRVARLSLARALAFGTEELVVNAPVLLLEADGRDLLRRLPERFKVGVKLVAGDLDLGLKAAGSMRQGEIRRFARPGFRFPGNKTGQTAL